MARTLYMNDGSTELVLGDPKDTLQKIIGERLGDDCVELFKEVTALEDLTGEDYEKIADSYRTLLQDTLAELDLIIDMFDSPRIARQRLEAVSDDLHKYL